MGERIGALVRVVSASDDAMDSGLLGRTGLVVDAQCSGMGLGESPEDPVYRVKFAPSFGRSACADLFWGEELQEVANG